MNTADSNTSPVVDDAMIEQLTHSITEVFKKFTAVVPSFPILNEEYLPDGLKPHTRDRFVGWLNR